MLVSIGVLAWNEAGSIATTLRSLFEQSIFQKVVERGDKIEFICVPNGCSDDTAQVAADCFAQDVPAGLEGGLTCVVKELQAPGKVNAWNEYIHRLADATADYFFLVDADISLCTPDTLWNMLRALEENPVAQVATDQPLKHVLFKEHKNLFDRISLSISGMTKAAPAQITGQLYCARGELLRRIWMPKGLVVEDGFLKQMVVSDLLSQPPDNNRVIRADDASHVFEAYTGIRDIFLNQKRQAIGHTVYVYLREYLQAHQADEDAGQLITRMSAEDNDWFLKVINERTTGRWWVMHPGALMVRFRRLRNLSPIQAVLKFPVACLGFGMDVLVYLAANRALKTGGVKGIWQDTRTTEI